MGIRNPRPLAPLSKADSPYQGEMSRRDKRDRARWHGTAVTEGFRPQESCPKNGIPQSASLTAPFNKEAKGRGLRIATSARWASSQ